MSALGQPIFIPQTVGVSAPSTTAPIIITEYPGSDGVLTRHVELHRPEKLNCLSLAMLDQLLTALATPSTERLVLTGAGRAFCSGLDLSEVAGPTGGRLHLQKLVAIYRQILSDRAPVTVLARGFAVGGGAGLVACAARAIVAEDFRFRLPGGALARLAAVVVPLCQLRAGTRLPATGAWLGCDLSATEARQLGLVDRVVPSIELDQMLARLRLRQPLELSPSPTPARNETAIQQLLADWETFLHYRGPFSV